MPAMHRSKKHAGRPVSGQQLLGIIRAVHSREVVLQGTGSRPARILGYVPESGHAWDEEGVTWLVDPCDLDTDHKEATPVRS